MNSDEHEIELKLIRDTAELDGTCYFEFFPDKYHDHCWNKTSVYLTEDTMGLLEGIFEKHIPNYDHFAFMEVSESAKPLISEALIDLAKKLRNQSTEVEILPFSSTLRKEHFIKILSPKWSNHKEVLSKTCSDLSQWLNENAAKPLTIMGM